MTTIDPATGIKSPETEPLRTLKTYVFADFLQNFFITTFLDFVFHPNHQLVLFSRYRQATDPVLRSAIGESPQLGIDLSLDHPGRIRVGDVVYAGVL